jgi:hypothetical protein
LSRPFTAGLWINGIRSALGNLSGFQNLLSLLVIIPTARVL